MKPEKTPAGVESRRAALRLLDAVLRRGLPLEAALDAATRDLGRPEDRGLAHAIGQIIGKRHAFTVKLASKPVRRVVPALDKTL